MTIKVHMVENGSPAQVFSKRKIARAHKGSNAAVGNFWANRLLPGHFTAAAKRRYGYHPRGAKYEQLKQKIVGHRDPLVLSGDMRDMILSSKQVRAFPKRVTVRINGPRYLSEFRRNDTEKSLLPVRDVTPRTGRPPSRMAAEIKAVNSSELNVMQRIKDKVMTAILNRPDGRRRRRIA